MAFPICDLRLEIYSAEDGKPLSPEEAKNSDSYDYLAYNKETKMYGIIWTTLSEIGDGDIDKYFSPVSKEKIKKFTDLNEHVMGNPVLILIEDKLYDANCCTGFED